MKKKKYVQPVFYLQLMLFIYLNMEQNVKMLLNPIMLNQYIYLMNG